MIVCIIHMDKSAYGAGVSEVEFAAWLVKDARLQRCRWCMLRVPWCGVPNVSCRFLGKGIVMRLFHLFPPMSLTCRI